MQQAKHRIVLDAGQNNISGVVQPCIITFIIDEQDNSFAKKGRVEDLSLPQEVVIPIHLNTYIEIVRKLELNRRPRKTVEERRIAQQEAQRRYRVRLHLKQSPRAEPGQL